MAVTLTSGSLASFFSAACWAWAAIGALSAAHEAGLRIPQDLSVIGFDDIELARFTSPPLTTIVQPKQRIGQLAVEMLLERIQGGRTDTKQMLLPPELVVRASTAPKETP